MMDNKKLNLASAQANKIIAELPGRRDKFKAQAQILHGILEF